MNLHANDRIPFFFILGRPRSGTTLIRTLFDAHPNVKIPPEFPFIPLLARRFRNMKEWDARQILQFVDHLFKIRSFGHRTIDQLRINRLELTADLLCLEKHINLGEFIKRVNLHTGSWFPKLDIHAVGDKNPLYSIFISLLMKLIPDARFICLVRDYRDTYLSMGNVKGRPIEAPLLSLQVSRWRYVSRRFLYFQKKHPKRFILVSYEDFVADPVRRFRELTRFHCGEIRRYAWLRTTIQDLESFPLAKNQTYGIVCHVVVPAHGSQPLSSLRSDPVGIGKNCHAGSALYPVYVEKEKAGSGKIVDPSFRGRFGTDICTTLYCFSLKL